MMNVLVISFVVCMMPIKTKQLLEMLWPRLARPCTLTGHYIEASIHFICHWLGMAHSFVNPIISSVSTSPPALISSPSRRSTIQVWTAEMIRR